MTRKTDSAGTPANPLGGLAPPGAPPELKTRVLSASRAALRAEPARPDRWSVLWASRPLRLAWAASVLFLLAGHAVLVRSDRPQGQAAKSSVSRSVNEADPELATIGHLPRLDPDARPLGTSPVRPSRPSPLPEPEQPKENRT